MDARLDKFDLAVIGAGVGGASAAIVAAQSGARVALLEGGVAGRHKVCGEFLSPEGRVQLELLGVWDALQSAGARQITMARVLTSRKTSRAVPLPAPGIAISRGTLDSLLWRRALEAGVSCFEKTRVTGIENSEDGFSFEANGVNMRARFVVCAAGRGSKFGRDGDATVQESRRPRFVGLKTHLRGARVEAGQVQLFPLRGGYCGLVGIEDGLVNACLLLSYARSKGCSPEQLWQEVQAENSALARAMESATLEFPWLATGNVSFDCFAPARDGILRVGDAAGYIPPLSGDGMAMAMRSGELAARAIGHALKWGLTPETAAGSYSQMWQREFAARLKWAGRLQPLFCDQRLTKWTQGFFDLAPGLSRLMVRRTRGPVGT